MKIITEDERKAHDHAVMMGGFKGAAIGTAISLGLTAFAKKRYQPKLDAMTYSMKTALFVTPPTLCCAIGGEKASQHFDTDKYVTHSQEHEEQEKEDADKWNNLSTSQKAISVLDENKYKIITGLWALSMWGSWEYVNKDKLMTQKQKFYEARMYAQFITIALLLGSIGLSMADEQGEKKKFSEDDDELREVMARQKKEAAEAKAEKAEHERYVAAQKAKKDSAAAAASAAASSSSSSASS